MDEIIIYVQQFSFIQLLRKTLLIHIEPSANWPPLSPASVIDAYDLTTSTV